MSNNELLSRPHSSVREGIAQDFSFPHMLFSIGHTPCTQSSVIFWPNIVVLSLFHVGFGAVDRMVSRRGVGHNSIRTITKHRTYTEGSASTELPDFQEKISTIDLMALP